MTEVPDFAEVVAFTRAAEAFDWMNRAACAGRRSQFFSDRDVDKLAAFVICLRCPVCQPCARWRDRTQPKHGIWAGAVASTRTSN
ncbi:WhiB family transcriptional regulator [Janibacter sp. GXQ6167]|uniref:WhiB family transcriptional regulator n=1 Tax=Janibacter sp. GXQ6167 TaxID=3240791 RepID=UPI0035253D99